MPLCPPIQDNNQLINWIFILSGNCVYGKLSALSWACGKISFIAWLGAQLPQVAENYLNQSVDGLSWIFLLNWFIGDFTNLLGCLLTHQLPFQTLLAFYYINVDIILGIQYIYYSSKDHRRQIILDGKDPEEEQLNQEGSQSSPPTSSSPIPIKKSIRTFSNSNLKAMVTASFIASFTKVRAAPMTTENATASILLISSSRIGRISAWICAVMYLTSRMPQIYKNFCRKSTWGTSMLLFSAALTGNITYTLSILLSPEATGVNGSKFLLNELPFLIGSAGTVCFDITILFQRYLYGNERPYEEFSYGHSHSSSGSSSHSHHAPHSHTHAHTHTHAHAHTSNLQPSSIHYRPHQPLLEDYDDVNDTTPLSLSLQSNYSA